MQRRRVICTALLVGGLGCAGNELPESDEMSSDSVGVTTQALQAAAPLPDNGSRPAIVVEWRDRSAERKNTQAIDIVLENTSDYSLQVDLALVATDDGEAVKRSFDKRTVKPHSTLDVAVPIALVPVQSAGIDTPVWVSASYSISAKHPFTNATVSLSAVSVSEPRRLTFSGDFGSATSRDYKTQLAYNTSLGNTKPTPVKRRFDSASARAVAATSSVFTTSFRSMPVGAPGTPPVLNSKGGTP